MKLEVVPIPVTDVDRAKEFYASQVGFHLDHDVQPGNGMRVVQLTPPGSHCSIVIGTGMGEITEMQPGSIRGLHLVVSDVASLRAELIARGIAVGEIDAYPEGIKYARFTDPDGNAWLLQELPPGLK